MLLAEEGIPKPAAVPCTCASDPRGRLLAATHCRRIMACTTETTEHKVLPTTARMCCAMHALYPVCAPQHVYPLRLP
jgi:hypothetical protein